MSQTDFDESCPWKKGKYVDEHIFCEMFLQKYDLIYMGNSFYDRDGMILDEGSIRKKIYDELVTECRTGLQAKVDTLMGALKMTARKELNLDRNTLIHVANGTLDLVDGFYPMKEYCRNRLPVNYFPELKPSRRWENFLNDLLEPEDIITLQEYMGYCLIPSNHAQRMLLILGRGGEGKSRIGVVMKAMFGNALNISSLAKIEHSPFARADLENLLVMVDDDLRLEALTSTNYIKSIISADCPMDVERKNIQSYQARLYCRFIAFGNGSLQAAHDKSYGFYRRQIILTAKPRDPNREDDPFLAHDLCQEIDQIFLWCLEGLYRLVGNNFQFTISPKARANWDIAVGSQNNLVDFLKSSGYFQKDPQQMISAKELYGIYTGWCADNAVKPHSQKTFSSYLISNEGELGLVYTTNIPLPSGKDARGFRGIGSCKGELFSS